MSPNHPGRALSLILAALLGQSPPRRRSCCTYLLSSLRSCYRLCGQSVASAWPARRPSWPSGCATAVRRANWRRKSDMSMVTCPAAETAGARLPHTTPYRESCSSEVWEINTRHLAASLEPSEPATISASWSRASTRTQVALLGLRAPGACGEVLVVFLELLLEDLRTGVYRYGVGDDDALGRLAARQRPTRAPDHRFLRERGAWLGDDHGGDCLDLLQVGNGEGGHFGCEGRSSLISSPGCLNLLGLPLEMACHGRSDRGSRRASRTGRISPPRGVYAGAAAGCSWCRGGCRGEHQAGHSPAAMHAGGC